MVAENLNQVCENIEKACKKVGRDPKEVTLIAVSMMLGVVILERTRYRKLWINIQFFLQIFVGT